jgi:starch synthase
MRVLYATPECAPWIKTGGLGDVAGALTAQLHRDGVDIQVLMPAYRILLGHVERTNPIAVLPPAAALPEAGIVEAMLPSGVRALLIDCPPLFDREGGPYQDVRGHDFADNAQRFAQLSRTAAQLATTASPLDWRPEILHCNDWQTGPAPALLHHARGPRPRTLMTIHNLAFQGLFDGDLTPLLGLPRDAFGIEGIEFYGRTSFLKAGLMFADRLSTVSPTYAHEIQRSPLGMGLEGVLARRRDALTGLLNGIDDAVWNPARDPMLDVNYDATTIEAKAANKAALQRELGLDAIADRPLFGVISRLTPQKGSDLVAAVARRIATLPAQLAVLGTGDHDLERVLVDTARAHPGSVATMLRFDERLAHRIEAGADVFLMPSRFEPCGLNQMYSQRYGTPPVARATGGLVDSIIDASPATIADGTATGFLFDEPTPDGLWKAMARALDAFAKPAVWRAIQRAGMGQRFGWAQRSQQYAALYRSLLEDDSPG